MKLRVCSSLVVLVVAIAGRAAAQETPQQRHSEVVYALSLAHGAEHELDVTFQFEEEGAEHDLLLPVWNALYQIRDFAQFVSHVRAVDALGNDLVVTKAEKSRWSVKGMGRIHVSYTVYASESGPFGAEVNGHHAFLNLAQVLMFTPRTRGYLATLEFDSVPAHWALGIALPSLDVRANGSVLGAYLVHAQDYDHLVDSPAELGTFSEFHFTGNAGETYRVLVESGEEFDHNTILGHLKKITAAETQWMQSVPFREYTFIYHFQAFRNLGGMEHSYSTAIDVATPVSDESLSEFDTVSSHEFFHLWNVKRIRPRSLEPVDYMKENYCDALWFSEGVTTTVARMSLLAAGLITPAQYLERLAAQITVLQARTAHGMQSAEESSVDTWLEKYRYYKGPERSVSYYNKGDLLGVLLDLALRDATHGTKSLRDVFLYLNKEHGTADKPFDDSEGLRQAIQTVSGVSFDEFFRRYIRGVEDLPYEKLFRTVGVSLKPRTHTERDLGFDWEPSGSMSIIKGPFSSLAASAGLEEGDLLVAINHQTPSDPGSVLEALRDKRFVTVTLSRSGREQDFQVPLLTRTVTSYQLVEDSHASAEQVQRRKEWLAVGK